MPVTTPENPGNSPHMLWLRAHRDYPHAEFCLIWPFASSNAGYGTFVREKKKFYVHRVMCEMVNGPAPGPGYQAAHSCNRGHEGCANPRHLRWKTRSENLLESVPKAKRKLTVEQAREIKALKGLEPHDVTAERYGVHEVTVRDIQAGRAWRKENKRGHPFRDAEIQRIRSLVGVETASTIAAEYGVRENVIRNIWKRTTWKHVPEAAETRIKESFDATRQSCHPLANLVLALGNLPDGGDLK